MCVYVALVTLHAQRMCRIITCVALPHFPTLSHKRYDFRKKKKLLYTKCVLIFFTTLIQNTSHFKKNSGRYCHKYLYICLHIKYLLCLSDCNKNLYFLNRFSKNTQISNSMKICPVGAKLFPCGGTDGQNERREEVNSHFTQFIESNKMGMTLQHLGESQQIRCG